MLGGGGWLATQSLALEYDLLGGVPGGTKAFEMVFKDPFVAS